MTTASKDTADTGNEDWGPQRSRTVVWHDPGPGVARGLTMAWRWLSVYRAPGTPATPPERNFPLPVVIGHGVLAAATVTLVAITTLSG